MYKLLTTAAVILTVATPSFAWTDAESLTKNLDQIYSNLDGQNEFTNLQGSSGELNAFLGNVNQGVTHLSLAVDDANQITAKVNAGTTLDAINISADNLVNRVSYDLFVQTEDENGVETSTYSITGGYAAGRTDLTFDEEGVDPIGYSANYDNGLLGRKVTQLTDNVDAINNVLIGTGASAERDNFITNWGDGTNGTGTIGLQQDGSTPLNIADVQANIGKLNNTATVIGGTAGDNTYNESFNGFTQDANSVNSFFIKGLLADGTINDGTDTYGSILEWAQRNDG